MQQVNNVELKLNADFTSSSNTTELDPLAAAAHSVPISVASNNNNDNNNNTCESLFSQPFRDLNLIIR